MYTHDHRKSFRRIPVHSRIFLYRDCNILSENYIMIGEPIYRIKVKCVSIPHFWYKSKVGEMFDARFFINPETNRVFYKVVNNPDWDILGQDVEVIDEQFIH